ncbi:MAG: hypothetical protein K0S94_1492, partial [Nitrospira sp.]|nr:hypothetical protein [Nitrospira sp.]
MWKPSGIASVPLFFLGLVGFTTAVPVQSLSSDQVQERPSERPTTEPVGTQYSIPGASFLVVQRHTNPDASERALDEAAARTVVEALTFMLDHRKDYPR